MNKRKLLTGPYLVWAVAFILIPLAVVLYYGLTNSDGQFTFENILAIGTVENFKALCLSLLLSFISTLICLLLAYPLAMMLSNMKVSQTSFMVLIFILPMWMNFLLRTMAWQTLLEKNGVINQILSFFHLPSIQIINTPGAIILAARDLGATSVYTFRKIIFPLSLPGVISGITMVFVPALTTFVISDLLGGSKILLIGNVIDRQFQQGSNWHVGSGLSLVLMVFILISMFLTGKYDKNGEGGMF